MVENLALWHQSPHDGRTFASPRGHSGSLPTPCSCIEHVGCPPLGGLPETVFWLQLQPRMTCCALGQKGLKLQAPGFDLLADQSVHQS